MAALPSSTTPSLETNLTLVKSTQELNSSPHPKHKCPYCHLEFTRHHNLKSHLLTHSQESPYACQVCGMRFRRLHELKLHSKLHLGEKSHACTTCNRKFARNDALDRHMRLGLGCKDPAALHSFAGDGIDEGVQDEEVDTRDIIEEACRIRSLARIIKAENPASELFKLVNLSRRSSPRISHDSSHDSGYSTVPGTELGATSGARTELLDPLQSSPDIFNDVKRKQLLIDQEDIPVNHTEPGGYAMAATAVEEKRIDDVPQMTAMSLPRQGWDPYGASIWKSSEPQEIDHQSRDAYYFTGFHKHRDEIAMARDIDNEVSQSRPNQTTRSLATPMTLPSNTLALPTVQIGQALRNSVTDESPESTTWRRESGFDRSSYTAASSDDSFDSDMISISDRSDQLDVFGTDSISAEIIAAVFHRLFQQWQMVSTCQGTEGRSQAQSISVPHDSITSSSSSSNNSSQKRKRTISHGDNDDEDGEGNGFSSPAKKKEYSGCSSKLFACPFWKKQPNKYRDCFPKKLSRIRDVKQHLIRRHMPAFYCERCLKVFGDRQSHQSHVMADERCPANLNSPLEGVSSEQQKALHRKSKRGCPEAQQWYEIWTILFDDCPKPSSPYMDFEQSLEFSEWVEFCQTHGPEIVTEEVNNCFEQLVMMDEAERISEIRRVVESGFLSSFETFRALSASTPSSVDQEPTPSSRDDNNKTGVLSAELPDFGSGHLFDGLDLNHQIDETQANPLPPFWPEVDDFPMGHPPLQSRPWEEGAEIMNNDVLQFLNTFKMTSTDVADDSILQGLNL